jgi:hypothetical protein
MAKRKLYREPISGSEMLIHTFDIRYCKHHQIFIISFILGITSHDHTYHQHHLPSSASHATMTITAAVAIIE